MLVTIVRDGFFGDKYPLMIVAKIGIITYQWFSWNMNLS